MDRSSAKTTAGRTRGGPNTPDVFYSQSNSSYGPRARGRDGDQGRGQSQPSQPPRAPLSSPSSTSFSFPSSRRHRNEQINGPLPPTPSSNPIPAKPPRLSPGLSPTSPIPFDQRSPNRSFDRLDSNESFESSLPGKAAAAAYREVPDEYPLTHYSSERDGPDMERAGVRQPRVRRDFRRDTRELPDPVPQKPAARSGGGGARSYLREKYETHFKISRHTPFFCYLITLIQILVFIAELAVNTKLTNSPIQTQPVFNPMIGPSPYVLINMGARFVPCQRSTPGVQNATQPVSWPCPNTTTYDLDAPTMKCTLADLCGFPKSPVPNPIPNGSLTSGPQPNQWFRFVIPIFLHAGFIHIAFNLLLQMLIGRDMERKIGAVRFALVYFASGIFGFVLGGNFAPAGVASTGASGALFGIIALELIDLTYTWSDRTSPGRDLLYLLVDILVSFALGLLPGLDNFSHIGGFAMGLLLGVFILHSPNALRRRILQEPYSPVSTARAEEVEGWNEAKALARQPVGFFKGRKPFWWVWWVFRMVMAAGAVILFVVLLRNFYAEKRVQCPGCKYLSCLPIKNWCDLGNLDLKSSNSTSPNPVKKLIRREFFGQ